MFVFEEALVARHEGQSVTTANEHTHSLIAGEVHGTAHQSPTHSCVVRQCMQLSHRNVLEGAWAQSTRVQLIAVPSVNVHDCLLWCAVEYSKRTQSSFVEYKYMLHIL